MTSPHLTTRTSPQPNYLHSASSRLSNLRPLNNVSRSGSRYPNETLDYGSWSTVKIRPFDRTSPSTIARRTKVSYMTTSLCEQELKESRYGLHPQQYGCPCCRSPTLPRLQSRPCQIQHCKCPLSPDFPNIPLVTARRTSKTDLAAQLHADANNPPYMIFLKWFDCSRQTLQGQGKLFVNKGSKISDLLPYIQEKMKWPSSTPIKLYEVGVSAQFQAVSSFLLFLYFSLPALLRPHRVGLISSAGNQSRDDRGHEDEADFPPKRDPRWRCDHVSGRIDRERVRL